MRKFIVGIAASDGFVKRIIILFCIQSLSHIPSWGSDLIPLPSSWQQNILGADIFVFKKLSSIWRGRSPVHEETDPLKKRIQGWTGGSNCAKEKAEQLHSTITC